LFFASMRFRTVQPRYYFLGLGILYITVTLPKNGENHGI
jgi:hypothetical protein